MSLLFVLHNGWHTCLSRGFSMDDDQGLRCPGCIRSDLLLFFLLVGLKLDTTRRCRRQVPWRNYIS
jgi:hypothetical protein